MRYIEKNSYNISEKILWRPLFFQKNPCFQKILYLKEHEL